LPALSQRNRADSLPFAALLGNFYFVSIFEIRRPSNASAKDSRRSQFQKSVVPMVHDGHCKRKLGDVWAQLVLSAFTLLVPPLGMVAGVMYLSPPPQAPEHQVAERADMRSHLAASQHPVIVERPPLDDGPAAFPHGQITKDPTRFKGQLEVEHPPATVIADLAGKAPQGPATSRRLAARATTPVAAVEDPAASDRSAPRANESGTWMVQLSAQATEDAALSAFHAAQAKYAALAGYQVLIRKKDQGSRGVFYAAQVGPLARDEASGLCSRIKSAGGKCFTLEN
jgi:hypothetical protein